MASPEEESRPPKEPRIDSSGLTTCNFLYFGLSFFWQEVALEKPFVCIPLIDLPSSWMVTAIREDLKKFQPFPEISSSSENTFFKHVEETNIWLFQHTRHASCSTVLYEHFQHNLSICTACAECDTCLCFQTQDGSHFILEPFFRDNVSLQRTYTALAEAEHLSERERERLLGSWRVG